MVEVPIISFILGIETMHLINYLKPFIPPSNLLISSFFKVCHLMESSNSITTTSEVRPLNGEEISISVSEVNNVMRSLGMCTGLIEDSTNELKFVDKDSLDGLFEEEEPCLEEIWEAFQVFDMNKDGFIDAKELGRVLCSLGYVKEGSDVERCKKMIRSFDRNDDGLLDFNDFLKFMHTCLC